jgi:hypothetical protein
MAFLGAGSLWSMNFSKIFWVFIVLNFSTSKLFNSQSKFFIGGENIPKIMSLHSSQPSHCTHHGPSHCTHHGPSHCTHHGLPMIPRAQLEIWWFERSQCDKQGIKNKLALPIDKMLLCIYLLCPHSEHQNNPFQSKQSKHFHQRNLFL